MAEQVNQRLEDMVSELEQMRRISLYNDEEIRDISRKRKEFEYKIQRRVKQKDDFVLYIAYELALLEDINIRRKQLKQSEKKREIEYAISGRLNRLFKQFIYRFRNDVEVYFQYIKFCQSVGFESAISGIIGEMLQMHGDKPKMWLMASKWESLEEQNLQNARSFLLKGIHRHPESEILYLELFKIEMKLACEIESEEEKDKQIKKANIIWKNGAENVKHVEFLFKLLKITDLFVEAASITTDIKNEIWSRNNEKEVLPLIAQYELQGSHWEQVEELVSENESNLPNNVKYCIAAYEEALEKFPEEKLCSMYIHSLLGVTDELCSDLQKVKIVKHAWMFGHESGLLTNEMYSLGIELLKLENETPVEELVQILETASRMKPNLRCIWEELLILNKSNEKKMFDIVQQATKSLKKEDTLYIWNLMLDNIKSKEMVNILLKKIDTCENYIVLTLKPKVLLKIYSHIGLKSARELYEEFIRTPPQQIEVHTTMIEIEKKQIKPNNKFIRKCYECLIHHHGTDNVNAWLDYLQFEIDCGNVMGSPAIHRRAIASLKKELVDDFIKAITLSKIKKDVK